MDAGFNIYELTEEQKAEPDTRVSEDVARLEGYLKGRSESDRHKHEKLVHDSSKDGTLRNGGT